MTKAKPGGYNCRQMLTAAINLNREGRGMFERALRETPGSTAMSLMLYRSLAKWLESYAALLEMQRIWDEERRLESAKETT